ncbi:DNA polymerase III subunit delta' [Aestuariirhabdus litorea]|uniref:DNA polymerase III subunit delta' n=1 Tax=Aestuariirhabdus litorea TaxID=2528527 RepID=A0A3P3VTA8_9GAMM|nr:DNA polymerase III subunit delta' [Aestuariirhabdus litorea]RRJ84709.1 DNA polymerase III subunit delta' [Aestuariirhabdus litorea]RWW97934.1 DNA polymerase III subunit delta' [Endozoicomonadaceae bacterium GTF-13]
MNPLHGEPRLHPYPWQADQWQRLCAQHQEGRLSHAYLLKGAPGVGKFAFASAFAGYVLCEQPEGDAACGGCKSCHLFRSGGHPDLRILQPEEGGRVIKVDQVRALIEFASKTAQQGGYRVIIINPAEAMNSNSANALLKSLEEPGAQTLILLVTARQGAMLATINSRCQQLPFTLPQRQQSLDWLAGLSNEESDQLELLLVLADGQPLTALQFANEQMLKERARLIEEIGSITKGKHSPIEIAQRWKDQDLPRLLGWVSGWVADILRLQQGGEETPLNNPDLRAMATYIAKKANTRSLFELQQWINEQRALCQGAGNLNRQLLLEDLLIRWLHLTLG